MGENWGYYVDEEGYIPEKHVEGTPVEDFLEEWLEAPAIYTLDLFPKNVTYGTFDLKARNLSAMEFLFLDSPPRFLGIAAQVPAHPCQDGLLLPLQPPDCELLDAFVPPRRKPLGRGGRRIPRQYGRGILRRSIPAGDGLYPGGQAVRPSGRNV